jgi:hypothetical protein
MTAHPIADSQLNPAARLLWRGKHSVQLELGDHAVVLDGVPIGTARALVSSARGPQGEDARGPAGDPIGPVRALLTDGGFLWPRTDEPDDPRLAPPAPRLAGELSALTALHGERAA